MNSFDFSNKFLSSYASVYKTSILYKEALEKIEQAQPENCLMVKDNGEVLYASRVRQLWEHFKGLIGGVDHTKPSEVQKRVLDLRSFGEVRGWLNDPKIQRISQIALEIPVSSPQTSSPQENSREILEEKKEDSSLAKKTNSISEGEGFESLVKPLGKEGKKTKVEKTQEFSRGHLKILGLALGVLFLGHHRNNASLEHPSLKSDLKGISNAGAAPLMVDYSLQEMEDSKPKHYASYFKTHSITPFALEPDRVSLGQLGQERKLPLADNFEQELFPEPASELKLEDLACL